MKKLFTVPILLMAYNRPDTTAKVFEKIKKIKPLKLYVSVDGPKNIEEKYLISKVKKIVSDIDWDCKIKTRFRKKNLGVRYGPMDAVNWFFQNEKKGIILEDDCVPDLSFFKFCKILLNYYNYDKRILFINGSNFQDGQKRNKYSYYFSKYPSVWGWASWRRAWNYYDSKLSFWPNWRDSDHFKKKFPDQKEQKFWKNKLDTYYNSGPFHGAWDNQLVASIIYNNGLCITPNNNLITNIGFGKNATHHKVKHLGNDKPTKTIKKVSHAKKFIQDKIADWYYFYYYYNGRSLHMPWFLFDLPKRALGYFRRIFKSILQR